MGNRKKSESMSYFVQTQLSDGVDFETIVKGIADGIQAGRFKSCQNPRSVVVWYANYYRKKGLNTATPTDTPNETTNQAADQESPLFA